MLLNDLSEDLKMVSRWERITKSELAIRGGITKQTLNQFQSRNKGISEKLIEVLDKNGYDIEIVYKKKVK